MKKILLATIVPFWNRETGAHQRIFSLVKAIQDQGHQVRIFFIGRAEPADYQSSDRLNLEVAFHSSDQPSLQGKSLAEKLKWQIDAVIHAIKNRFGETTPNPTQRLGDFRWPWAEDAFTAEATRFVPDAIICQYITTAYLIKALPTTLRRRIHCFIDTHDLLSERQRQFRLHQRSHWIDVSSEEEAAALNLFDTIMAIQPLEAEKMKAMVPEKSVIVVAHQPAVVSVDAALPRSSGELTFGYLGSDNDSNVDAINEFLDVVWRQFNEAENLRLCVAGKVADRVAENFRFENVQLLGPVSDVSVFYDAVDAVINPVSYGTGLKIKSVEARAFAKPLLCSAAGWVGLAPDGITVVEELETMADFIGKWSSDRAAFLEVCQAAKVACSETGYNAYDALLTLLEQL